jgi:hypothetical protein
MQASWDNGLGLICAIHSDEVYRKSRLKPRRSLPENGNPSARSAFAEVKPSSIKPVATVLFDAMQPRSPASQADLIREAWHFSIYKPSAITLGFEGIQQMENTVMDDIGSRLCGKQARITGGEPRPQTSGCILPVLLPRTVTHEDTKSTALRRVDLIARKNTNDPTQPRKELAHQRSSPWRPGNSS